MRTRPRSGAPSSRKGVGIEGIIEVVERVAASYFEHRMATPHAHRVSAGAVGGLPSQPGNHAALEVRDAWRGARRIRLGRDLGRLAAMTER